MLYSSRKNLQTCHSNPLFRPPYSSKVTLNINLDALRFEFYTNGAAKGHLFTTFVRGVPIHLVAKDITHILVIRLEADRTTEINSAPSFLLNQQKTLISHILTKQLHLLYKLSPLLHHYHYSITGESITTLSSIASTTTTPPICRLSTSPTEQNHPLQVKPTTADEDSTGQHLPSTGKTTTGRSSPANSLTTSLPQVTF
ncbi:hypothetical protein FXO37_03978 [Capsicum annuum]|nr:hypothetical protein FXO37_03978 [Capsicum annuum]